jgi:Nucleoside phosphorylase
MAYAGSNPNYEEIIPQKQQEYRAQQSLFPDYYDFGASERKMHFLGKMEWVARLGTSATDAIADDWSSALDSGALISMLPEFWRGADRSGGRTLETSLGAMPEALDGRAFILSEVERTLGSRFSAGERTRLNWLINRSYLSLYVTTLNANIMVDTNLGELDCHLRLERPQEERLISFRHFDSLLRAVKLSRFVQDAPVGRLVEVKFDAGFRACMDELCRASVLSDGADSRIYARLSTSEVARSLADWSPPSSDAELERYLPHLVDLLRLDSERLERAVLPSARWLKSRRGAAVVPVRAPMARQMTLIGGTIRMNVAIITVTETEHGAVLAGLGPCEMVHGKRWYSCTNLDVDEGQLELAVVATGDQGGVAANSCARDIIDDRNPDVIVLVGIGGGVPSDDYTLGDVVVARSLQDVRVRALQEAGEVSYNAVGTRTHYKIRRLLDAHAAFEADIARWRYSSRIPQRPELDPSGVELYGDDGWQERTRASLSLHFGSSARSEPRLHIGAMVSSDALVKDSEYARNMWKFVRSVAAFEMEAGGVYEAAESHDIPVLVVKGISDIVGVKRDQAWTPYAAASAAELVLELLLSGLLLRAIEDVE